MKKFNNSKFVILTIVLIILASPLLTYLLCLFIKTTGLYIIVPIIGSVDTWISFAGAILGGSITMLALYFTIQYQNNVQKNNEAIQIRPCLIGELFYQSKEEKVIMASEMVQDINRIFYIKWKLLNLTNNTANNVKLISANTIYINDSIDTIVNTDYLFMKTTIKDEKELLKSNEEKMYSTYFKLNRNFSESDKVDINGNYPQFRVKHVIIFEYTDLLNLQRYRNEFSFTLLIYLHQSKSLTILLEDLSNTQISPNIDNANS